MRIPTKFGYTVKTKLLEIGQTQQWLCSEITRRTGLFIDSGYLYKILSNQREAATIRAAIKDILDLPDEGGETK